MQTMNLHQAGVDVMATTSIWSHQNY